VLAAAGGGSLAGDVAAAPTDLDHACKREGMLL
jgi:hypothetical protein